MFLPLLAISLAFHLHGCLAVDSSPAPTRPAGPIGAGASSPKTETGEISWQEEQRGIREMHKAMLQYDTQVEQPSEPVPVGLIVAAVILLGPIVFSLSIYFIVPWEFKLFDPTKYLKRLEEEERRQAEAKKKKAEQKTAGKEEIKTLKK